MATAKVFIKSGVIQGYEGRYFESISKKGDSIQINGWNVQIKNKKIVAVCEREYSHGTERKEKQYPLKDGTLGLSGGYVTSRYTYFREAKFQEFLDKYGITAVKRQDPNTTYKVRLAHYGGGKSDYEIITDGTSKFVDMSTGLTEIWAEQNPGTSAYEQNRIYSIFNAAFVIIEQTIFEGNNRSYSKILYTDKNIYSLRIEEAIRERDLKEKKKKEEEMASNLYHLIKFNKSRSNSLNELFPLLVTGPLKSFIYKFFKIRADESDIIRDVIQSEYLEWFLNSFSEKGGIKISPTLSISEIEECFKS